MHINQYYHLAERQEISAKTLLLKAGEIAKYTYFLEKGCIRIWFNSNGKDITFDVLFDGEGVSSVESFRTGHPSTFNIESLETCIVYKISRQDFLFMMQDSQAFKEKIEAETFKLLYKYQQLFLSRIKNNTEERYKELLHNRPEILQRVPHHYIASYLGITPVSLSRIRARL